MGAQSFFDALLPAEAAAVENALADELAYAAAAAVMAVTEAARALVEAGSAASVEEALARADRVVAQRIPRRVLEEHLGREG
jgi:anthranilate phosphoribosyltransferase